MTTYRYSRQQVYRAVRRTASILFAFFVAIGASANPAEQDSTGYVLDEVIVTGTNHALPQRLLPYTVSVIGDRQLESTGQTQVLSAISGMVPSLFVTQRSIFGFGVSNGGSGHIKLRGVGGERASGVLMLVDGQPQFAGIYSHHIADFYDKEYVERVEVLRGPGSVLYGSNAMAGAINVITKETKKDGLGLTLQSQYGSYNTWLSSLTGTARYGKFSALLSLSYDRTDGNVKNFDFKQSDGYAKLGYDFSEHWKGYLDYTLMNFIGNDPIYPRLSKPESTDIYHQDITRGEVSATVSNSYGSTGGAARVYYNYGNHFIDDPRHFHSTDDRLGVILYQTFRPWRGASANVGFDFAHYSGEIPVSGGNHHTEGSLSTIARKSITEYSPYLTFSQTLFNEILNLNAGLRIAGSDMFSTQAIPQFGFSVNPGQGLTVKGNLAMGYRNPSFRELYLYKMANPELQPEKMINYEVSVAKSLWSWLSAELTLYYCKGDNMIQVVDMKNLNTGCFINKGVEIAAHAHPLTNLSVNASYSYLHTSLSDLTGAPKNQYFVGVEYRPVKALSIGVDLKGVGGLYVSNDIANQNYALLNLKLSYQICREIAVFTRLENITDTRYVINRGYDMPGFTAMGGFKLTL